MSERIKNPHKRKSGVREFRFARTLVRGQRSVERLQDSLLDALYDRGDIKYLGSLAVTMLEAREIRKCVRKNKTPISHLKDFAARIDGELPSEDYVPPLRVNVDDITPLEIFGKNKLGLRLDDKEGELEADRERIEDAIYGHFEVVPDLRLFKPHLTLARIEPEALSEIQSESALHELQLRLPIPESVALNGLSIQRVWKR